MNSSDAHKPVQAVYVVVCDCMCACLDMPLEHCIKLPFLALLMNSFTPSRAVYSHIYALISYKLPLLVMLMPCSKTARLSLSQFNISQFQIFLAFFDTFHYKSGNMFNSI